MAIVATAALSAVVWYGMTRASAPDIKSTSTVLKQLRAEMPTDGLPPAVARPKEGNVPHAGMPSAKRLPSVGVTLAPSNGEFDRQMRRRYAPLMEQQKLGEIQAVAPAMGLSSEAIEKMERWNSVYYKTAAELESRPVDTIEEATRVRREIGLLRRAHDKAWLALLGSDKEARRYTELAAAFAAGRLDEALHPPPVDPNVPKLEPIGAPHHLRPHTEPDTAKYDPLFR